MQEIAQELEDRFGPPPAPAMAFVRAISLRPRLRAYKVLGCEASGDRVTLHLREDTPLNPAKVMRLAAQPQNPWKLTPQMKLTRARIRRRDRAREQRRCLRSRVHSHARLRTARRRSSACPSVQDAHVGAVTFIQRSDSSLRLNVHFHSLALDGVYVRDESGTLAFDALGAPTFEDVQHVWRNSRARAPTA